MSTADEQIRVSATVKRAIDRRKREDESYNDVLERLFTTDRDRNLLAGFGRWSDETAARARETRTAYKKTSKERLHRQREDR